jgi:hypothetical protein
MPELFVNKPNPLYDANFLATERIVVNQGGTYCFAPETLVVTKRGRIPISEIVVGDIVKTMAEDTMAESWDEVEDTMAYANTKETIKLTLADGSVLIATADHEIYFEGGWLCLKDIVSLFDERRMEKNTEL